MRKLLLVLVVLAMIAVVPVLAQDGEDMSLPDFIERTECEHDLSGQVIPLYHFGDISAAYAPITQPLVASIDDAIDYFNARGGICGATMEQINLDTANDPEVTQSVYDDFSTREPKPLLFLLYSSPDSELLREQLAEDEIPALISAGSIEGLYGEDADEPGWIFATNPLYVDQLGTFCEFVANNPDNFPENPTIGYISWPGAFGEAAFTAETRAFCEEQGVAFLETAEIFLPTDSDVITQVLNLTDAGANILYTNTLASGPPVIARTLVDLGLDQDVVLAGVNWAVDSSVGLIDQQTRGANGLPAVDGMYGSLPFLWWTEVDEPSIALVREQFAIASEAKGRDAAAQIGLQNITYLIGWSSVDLYIELVIQTANRVGPENLDGAAIKETIETINYEPLGGFQSVFFGEDGQLRDTLPNRIIRYGFLNADGTGPATSAEDATVSNGLFLPIAVPLMDFEDTPDLRPGSMMGEE